LNVADAAGQAKLLGLNQLYRGTGGLCGTGTANVNWAHNGSTAGGKVLTSPVISLDGTKIAYVESAASSTIFHILTWRTGEGTSATAAVVPTLNGSCTTTPTVSSCLKSVTLPGTAADTSPWIDYQTDTAFVGTDDGRIHKISCVFSCALNSQPTVLWSFTLPVAGTGGTPAVPNGPVCDFPSWRLFVGDQLGELWVINAKTNTPTLNAGPVMIGGGGCTTNPPGRTGTPVPCTANGGSFGIPDAVLMDSSGGSQRIFAFSGNDGTAGASAVVTGGAGHHDLLVSGLVGAAPNGYIITNDISTGAIISGQSTSVQYPGGVSGLVLDNISTTGQASSVYFSTQGVVNVGTCHNQRCAIKLTQLGLN
jgi:hypothetical protein